MMKEMYCVKVSFRGYTTECESKLTNIFVKMGLTVKKTGDQEYTIISKDENTIDDIIYLGDCDMYSIVYSYGRKWK